MTLTVVVITNQTTLNPILLKSISFADEILMIIDSHQSKPALRQGKIKKYFRPLNQNFAAQRNFALSKAKSDWILFVDSDEYVGSELALEITSAIQHPKVVGYLLPRLDVVFHQPLLHGETGHLKLLRLAQLSAGEFHRPVHEIWRITGSIGELRSPLYHQKDYFVSEFMTRIGQYGPVDALALNQERKPFSWFRLFLYPLAKFKYNYFLKAGFLDGLPGLFLAYLLAIQSLSVRVFQWENQKP